MCNIFIKEMRSKNKEDEEEDPLDAFMAGIESEVNIQDPVSTFEWV